MDGTGEILTIEVEASGIKENGTYITLFNSEDNYTFCKTDVIRIDKLQ
jgi:hypothetical protein